MDIRGLLGPLNVWALFVVRCDLLEHVFKRERVLAVNENFNCHVFLLTNAFLQGVLQIHETDFRITLDELGWINVAHKYSADLEVK